MTVSAKLREQIAAEYNHTCAYCKIQTPFGHVDHIKPISRGGTDDRRNLQYLCPKCNQSKANKTIYFNSTRPMTTERLSMLIFFLIFLAIMLYFLAIAYKW